MKHFYRVHILPPNWESPPLTQDNMNENSTLGKKIKALLWGPDGREEKGTFCRDLRALRDRKQWKGGPRVPLALDLADVIDILCSLVWGNPSCVGTLFKVFFIRFSS